MSSCQPIRDRALSTNRNRPYINLNDLKMTRKSESLGWIIVPKDLLDYLSGPGLTVTTPDEQNCHI